LSRRWPKERDALLHKLLQPHFDVVALVEDGRAFVRAATRLSPDVIVADRISLNERPGG
jgi:hypothetical protein